MNILLIGNGFDLAHGLPTRYKDFLGFIYVLSKALDYKNKPGYVDLIDKMKTNPEIKSYLRKEYPNYKESRSAEMLRLSKDNVWIEFFLKINETAPDGWVDFEHE